MDMPKAIIAAGREAVEIYKEVSGAAQDNEVHERFLSSVMALKLHEALHLLAKVEWQYTRIAEDSGLTLDGESRSKITGLSADLALYDGGRPLSLIEIKIVDELMRAGSVHDDLHKGDFVNLTSRVSIYAGVLLCEIKDRNLDARKSELERITACHWAYSDPVLSRSRVWRWCFGCGSALISSTSP